MSIRRTLRILTAATVVAAALGWWWFGGPRAALYGSSASPRPAHPTLSPTATRTAPPGRRLPLVARGPALGTVWTMTSSGSDRAVCVSLALAEGAGDSGTCWHGEHGFVQALRASAQGGEFWFGPAPLSTARVWAALDDGRTVYGSVYHLPSDIDPSASAYLIAVPGPVGSGTVVAVGKGGRLVGQAHTSASDDPRTPVAALDVYGNVVGYIPFRAGLPLLTPGRHASIAEVRDFARYQLHRIRPAIRGWWGSRPGRGAPDGSFDRWWNAYPIEHLTRRSPASR